jgi:hypothetical protein
MVQIPLRTSSSVEVYAANEEWRSARLPHCPLHPAGGCGFARHGTYERVTPPRVRIARWYCPRGHRTCAGQGNIKAAQRISCNLNAFSRRRHGHAVFNQGQRAWQPSGEEIRE